MIQKASHLDPLIILFHLRFTGKKTPEMLERRIIHYRIKICYKVSSENSKKEYTFSHHKKGIDELRAGVELHMHVR